VSNEYLDMFIEESRENLEQLEVGLMRLETEGPADVAATIRELFRFAHNLKGMAATVGQDGITSLAHRMEDLLDLYRNNVASPTADAVDELLAGTDALGTMLNEVPSGAIPPAPADLLAKLETRIDQLNAIAGGAQAPVEPAAEESTPVPAAEPEPVPVADPVATDPLQLEDVPTADPVPAGACRFEVALKSGAALPGARSAVVLKAIENTGPILGTSPDRESILAGRAPMFSIDAVVPDGGELADKLRGLTDVGSVSLTEGPKAASGEVAAVAAGTGAAAAASGPNARATVRVEVERLDDLMNLVGELVIGRGQLEQRMRALGDRTLSDVVTGLSRTISDLQAAVARARMITLEGTFSRLQRLARDTSRDLGKDIAFTMSGAETELDRSMIDKVADPLVHLLRNALDHGIENPDLRTSRGKAPRGKIDLAAKTEGNQVIITISDDGDGIDTERVVEKALAKDIITPEQAAGMDEADKQNLIFLPGFSTKDQASAVSGRGVGMDVVRSSVSELGGSVDVESERGKGSTFRIRLPLSLAVLDVLLVSIAEQVWAIPLQHVEETISVGPNDIGGVLGSPVVTIRGETIGIIHGRRVIGHSEPPSAPFQAVVFRHRSDRWALSVDTLLEQAEVVVKPSPDEVGDVPHVAGATILGDGRVSMILDLSAIVTNLTRRDLRHAS
jgi:two-component system, chemotaxis family, sensor kinase CheA